MLSMLFVCVVSVFAAAPFAGSGTEADPWLITDADELDQLRNYRNQSYHFLLANDIDLTAFIDENAPEAGWSPIGSKGTEFCGTLDGDGHTISGLRISSTSDYVGLFGGFKGILKNLTVKGNVTGNNTTGGIVGYCELMSGSTSITQIVNCRMEGTVSGRSNVGGIVGQAVNSSYQNRLTISQCGFKGIVRSSNYDAGGIVGRSEAYSHTDCWVWGKIYGVSRAGGIAGYAKGRFVNCYVRADIAEGQQYAAMEAGGIVGWLEGTYFTGGYACIINCQYIGNMSSGYNVGGMASRADATIITNNIVRGTLRCTATNVGMTAGVVCMLYRVMLNGSYRYTSIAGNVVAATEITSSWINSTEQYPAARIVSQADLGGHTIGAVESSAENVALSEMTISNAGEAVDVSNYEHHGVGTAENMLTKQITYMALNYNFDSNWAMDPDLNEGYPYQQSMEDIVKEIAQTEQEGGTKEVSVSNELYATFYSSNAYQLPSDVEGAIVTGIDGLTLELDWLYSGSDEERNIIPAATPVVLHASSAGIYTLRRDLFNTLPVPSVNLLRGSEEAYTDSEPGYNYFILSLNSALDPGSVGFYFQPGTNGESVHNAANKAYLKLPLISVPAGVSGFNLNEGSTTGIVSVAEGGKMPLTGNVFTIDGRRVGSAERGILMSLPKGIYVVGGKKMVVK